MNKREFLQAAGAVGIAAAALSDAAPARAAATSLTDSAKPIEPAEREARIVRAQELMRAAGIAALLLEAGSTLDYFTGVKWWRSERFTGAVIPAEGELAIVTPHFEEPSVRESLAVGKDVRTWNEDEDPFARAAGILADRGVKSGRLAVEDTVRWFIADGMRRAAPNVELASGEGIVRGCRMHKTPAELALMQAANDVTLAAYRQVHGELERGMRPSDIASLMAAATTARGGAPEFSLVLLNAASAYPHGSEQPQTLKENSLVLMDCGCSVHGYQSDISRTWVYGEPTKKQRAVWETVKRGQELALETATVGTPAGNVDDVVRDYYERAGYGPGYCTPGLPHRLGHGIGMDVHEPVNFVQGEMTRLAPGMCFSNEPGLYIHGEFGVRLEDCLVITEDGPRLFTPLSPSIDQPFGPTTPART
jgi:Xaa-Pro dipeptidase